MRQFEERHGVTIYQAWDDRDESAEHDRATRRAGSRARSDPKSEDRFADGWLRTGDIATISPEGYVTKTSVGKFEKKEPRRRLASGDLGHRVVWAELTIATLVPSAA